MDLDRATLRTLSTLGDPEGVLSIYSTADPREESTTRPAWQVRIRNELAALRDGVRAGGSKARAQALEARLRAIDPELTAFLDPSAPGLGRALFAPLSSPETYTISVQLPLADLVVLEPGAHIGPLVAAWAAGAPAGVAVVSREGVRLVDYRFGLARDVSTFAFAEATGEWRELKGPAATNPQMGQQTAPQRDLFARRLADHLARFLADAGPRVGAVRAEQGWDDMVVTGDARLVEAFVAGLPNDLADEVLRLSHVVTSLTPAKVAATIAADLDTFRVERERRLAVRARDAALAGNAAAYGLRDTLGALQEGRVAHLLLDRTREWRGGRAPDGRLAVAGEAPPGVSPDALVPEARLGERMIQLALHGGGEATLLAPAAAAPLAEADGVAALLRW